MGRGCGKDGEGADVRIGEGAVGRMGRGLM